MTTTEHMPSPQLLFDTATAFQRTAAIKAAVGLDVFTAIAEGATDTSALARRCEASARGLRILCDYLTILGFLIKEGDRYGLTPDSAVFLDRRSPAYLGDTLVFTCAPSLMDQFADPIGAVRRGGTTTSEQGTMAPDHPIWVDFARAMAPMAAMMAGGIAEMAQLDPAQKARVLDIAASHGMYGIAMAQRYPGVEVVAVDWASVLELAQHNAESAGVADRFRRLPGSAFEVELGEGYDVVLLTNLLHHFDPPTCEVLLRRLHAALRPGGRMFTVEMVPNSDRVTPPGAAAFAFTMLNTTVSGDAYPFNELDGMLQRSGFARNEAHPLPGGMQSIVISYK